MDIQTTATIRTKRERNCKQTYTRMATNGYCENK